jgi:spermidine synthase
MNMKWMPCGIAFLVGAASLVQEVLWVRLAGFATGGVPATFAMILALYLLGIAAGAQIGRRLCAAEIGVIRRRASAVLLLSALIDIAAPFLFAWLIGFLPVTVAMLPLVIVTAALKSVLFPVVHHLGANDAVAWKGGSFSRVYFANVLGCTLGPLIVTLWLMDVLAMEQLFAGVAVVTSVAGIWLAGKTRATLTLAMVATVAIAAIPFLPALAGRAVVETGGEAPKWLLERKEGIIHTVADRAGDIVFGGNVYDGRINVDLRVNSNKIDRIYAAMIATPSPKRVLVIGLSGGSWTRIISSFPSVEQVDVVEINPGYLQLIAQYPEVAPIMHDSRIHIHIDDGRRWLRAQGDERYDAIIVNSTFHWRSGATLLLSREFFRLLNEHLTVAGVALVNTTGSPEVIKTAAAEFPWTYLHGNSVIMSRNDFRPSLRSGADAIYATRMDGKPVFDAGRAIDAAAVRSVIDAPLVGLNVVEKKAGRPVEVNTDLKMLTEYKYGELLR